LPETPPSFLRALGRHDPPAEFEFLGKQYVLRRVFKHDFFAATALYEGAGEKVILKIGRRASLAFLPLRWIGRLLARHEAAALGACRGIVGVPRLLGQWRSTGLVREYIEGRPLTRGMRVPDAFHSQLREIVKEIHGRGMAYVDLEKAENVLVGDDGRPYLIDFQIAWYVPRRWGGGLWPARAVCRRLQSGDLYHLKKLVRRTRPDLLTDRERAATYRKPWYVHVHAWFTSPLRRLRRRILNRLDPRRMPGERGRVAEDSFGGLS